MVATHRECLRLREPNGKYAGPGNQSPGLAGYWGDDAVDETSHAEASNYMEADGENNGHFSAR
jgi:hypothetical protein